MLQKETKVKTADNTGVAVLKCIHIKKKKKKIGFIGDLIYLIIKKIKREKNLKKKKIYFGLIINTKIQTYRKNGIFLKSDKNQVLLLNKENNQFLGTRLYSPVFKEIRLLVDGKKRIMRYEKIVSLAKSFI